MTEYMSCAATAKLLRQALKAAHPGVKFSVRSSTYAGGASIDVAWTDGPPSNTVDVTAKRYAGSTFDGMTDMKTHHSTILADAQNVREVHFGADFVFTERKESPEYVARCLPLIPEAPNGRDSGQCGGCGTWSQSEDRWMAHVQNHGGDFCCSRECAARKFARYTDSELVAALSQECAACNALPGEPCSPFCTARPSVQS